MPLPTRSASAPLPYIAQCAKAILVQRPLPDRIPTAESLRDYAGAVGCDAAGPDAAKHLNLSFSKSSRRIAHNRPP